MYQIFSTIFLCFCDFSDLKTAFHNFPLLLISSALYVHHRSDLHSLGAKPALMMALVQDKQGLQHFDQTYYQLLIFIIDHIITLF